MKMSIKMAKKPQISHVRKILAFVRSRREHPQGEVVQTAEHKTQYQCLTSYRN